MSIKTLGEVWCFSEIVTAADGLEAVAKAKVKLSDERRGGVVCAIHSELTESHQYAIYYQLSCRKRFSMDNAMNVTCEWLPLEATK